MSSIFDKRPKLTEEEKEQQRITELTTKKPTKPIFAAWFGYSTWQGLAKELAKYEIKIPGQHVFEIDISKAFYYLGIPSDLPEPLREWAKELRKDYKDTYLS